MSGSYVVPLTGEFQQVQPFGPAPVICDGIPGPLSANGIEATPNGRWLIVNSLARGELYRVDPATGDAKFIDLQGGDVCLADGNLLAGRTLYVMQNMAKRMAVVGLSKDYLSGTIERYISGTDPMTTMARFGSSMHWAQHVTKWVVLPTARRTPVGAVSFSCRLRRQPPGGCRARDS